MNIMQHEMRKCEMTIYNDIEVRLPSGRVVPAELGAPLGNGYRRVVARFTPVKGYTWMGQGPDRRVTVSGRVSVAHGFWDRVLPMEVNMKCVDARATFLTEVGENFAA